MAFAFLKDFLLFWGHCCYAWQFFFSSRLIISQWFFGHAVFFFATFIDRHVSQSCMLPLLQEKPWIVICFLRTMSEEACAKQPVNRALLLVTNRALWGRWCRSCKKAACLIVSCTLLLLCQQFSWASFIVHVSIYIPLPYWLLASFFRLLARSLVHQVQITVGWHLIRVGCKTSIAWKVWLLPLP